MSILKLLLVALLLQTTAPQRPRTGPVGSIEGVVVGATGEPLPNVSVTLIETVTRTATPILTPDVVRLLAAAIATSATNTLDPGLLEFIEGKISSLGNVVSYRQSSVTTGPDGKFIFENLSSTAYFLDVERQGYVSTEYGQKLPHGNSSGVASHARRLGTLNPPA